MLDSSREIVALIPDPANWGTAPRPFRGLVVGCVQSGKTASMIGVTAIALDQGFRVVVVASGGKDDLRRQTARRFNTQLLLQSDEIPGSGGALTLPKSAQVGRIESFALPYYLDSTAYAQLHLRMDRALAANRPVVLIVKKHVASLNDIRTKIALAFDRFGLDALPMLFLDDECDEASVEADEMAVPDAIANTWRRGGATPLIAYIGYTATAAANILQHQTNALFPNDFVYLLRSAGERSSLLTFREPNPDGWYSGGSTFYSDFGNEPSTEGNFLVTTAVQPADLVLPVETNPSLRAAVCAFIVSGAYRLALAPEREFGNAARSPQPHSMLVQTSRDITEHRRWLDGMKRIFDGADAGDRSVRWNPRAVERALQEDESEWRAWYDDFTRSRERILEERPRASDCGFATWKQVRSRIPSVVDHLRLKAVNSDLERGSDLDYSLRLSGAGQPVPGQDTFIIAIGGARLSRGITIEGLCVSYYTRWPANPTEDTVLQLSRWYGYRGSHLEFCRLFTTRMIYEQLEQMDENDAELRTQLGKQMLERRSPRDAAVVIWSNPHALPTAKLGQGELRDLTFSPFNRVFRHIEIADLGLAEHNQTIAVALIDEINQRDPTLVRAASGLRRGVLSRGWSSSEAANILDSFLYSDHNPSAEANPAGSYYRKPDETRPIRTARTLSDDPYQIAAYLRQWVAFGGAPQFNLGIAYGEERDGTSPFSFPLVNREVLPSGVVAGGWTGRRPGWRGDVFFDHPEPDAIIEGTSYRKAGGRGLILLYVIHKGARGRSRLGATREVHSPMLGVVIPDGGPTWRRVTIDRRRSIVA